MIELTDSADEFINDEELLIEAARYAVRIGVSRDAFMTQAKKAWFAAANEARVNPQTGKRRSQ